MSRGSLLIGGHALTSSFLALGGDERVEGGLGEDDVVADEDVVRVQLVAGAARGRSGGCERSCADLVVALEDDENVLRRGDAGRAARPRPWSRAPRRAARRLDDVQAAAASAVGEGTEQSCGDHLLGGALRVVARVWSVDDATAGHLRSADRALTSATGSLLLERLAAGTGDLAATLRVVRALAGGSELRDDDLVDQRDVGLHVEELGGELDGAGLLALGVDDVESGCGSHGLRPLHCVADEDDAAASAGNGALDEQQALLEVDRVNLEVQHGDALATHATGHAHALEDTAGGRGGADGAGLAVVAVRTVRGGDALEVVALHDAGEALALGGADDVDELAGLEDVDRELLAERCTRRRRRCGSR